MERQIIMSDMELLTVRDDTLCCLLRQRLRVVCRRMANEG